ncbi:hypothetical protein B566_EDAN008390 [Ephemera danica]|nr:hypothetical protein B566_EDAN008390 [Ephemera danica]
MTPVHVLAFAALLCSFLISYTAAHRLLQPSYHRASPRSSSDTLSSTNEIDQTPAGSEIGGSWGGPDESSHDGSRIQFHVQGHKGPKSYRFGYDTGHGKHRHFRYEERDEHGVVHGRYGFRDKHGHMRVYHYTAHPHHGYRASEASPHQYSHYRV